MKHLIAILIMALTANNVRAQEQQLVGDGDPAFYRVDTRTPPHQLPPRVCADAQNKRFEDGRAWPRYGTSCQPWGQPAVNLLSGANWGAPGLSGYAYLTVTLMKGTRYQYVAGNSATLTTGINVVGGRSTPGGAAIAPGYFVATQNTYYIWDNGPVFNGPVTAQINRSGNVCGYLHFDDESGFDTTVLLTDDWRDQAGEDGGRGRAWKILPGNVPVAIPMNGNDIYGTARLVEVYNGLVLLRQDNERHYFPAAGIAGSVIQLNTTPAWANGDIVYLWGDAALGTAFTAGANPPVLFTQVFVKNIGSNQVKLYSDSALTQQYLFTAAIGRFYLERQAASPGYFGNGAPPLIAQGTPAGGTVWDVGFTSVLANLPVSNTTAAGVWTVNNHRLIPGDPVTLSGMAVGDTPVNANAGDPNGYYYAYPLSDHTVQLYDTQVHALLAANGSAAGLEAISITHGSVPVMVKGGASGLPMPPAREGYYMSSGRLVLVNGTNNVLISDPLDPLHFTPMQDAFTANIGSSDPVTALAEISSSDTLVIGKQNSILALYNFSQGPSQWNLQSVTREYGCIAPLSMRQWGRSLMFLSRRGLDRLEYNAFGLSLGVEKPVSYDQQKYVNQIDWTNAALAVVETWNDRLFLAFPTKGQPAGSVQNNAMLVLNFLNSNFTEDTYGWEGVWTGTALNIYGLARLQIFGDQRLSFVNYNGQVCWFDDGFLDIGGVPIVDSLTTRRYNGGDMRRDIWNQLKVVFDTCNPTLTISAVSPGWNESYLLTPAGGLKYDRTQYVAGEGPAYNPATQVPPFNNPWRQDYSPAGPGELIGGQPDVHQNLTENYRMRVDDWGVQIVIGNSTGSCRIVSVDVGGFIGPMAGTRTV